ncbi:MAG: DUF1127 domain-containing protein [Pseudomonadota bacterium]
MTTMTKTQALPFGAITVHSVVRQVEVLRERIEDWRRTRATVAALRQLTPKQLEDIGLTIADVEIYAARGSW